MNIAKPLKTIKSLFLLVSASLTIVLTVEGQKPRVAACFAKHFEPISQVRLSSGGKYEFQRCTTPSPEQCELSYALANGNYDGVKCLIDAGYDFNVANGMYVGRNIPVTQAALYDPGMLELLFKSNIPIDTEVNRHIGRNSVVFRDDSVVVPAYSSTERLLLGKGLSIC